MLGLILFLIFINDMPEVLKCCIKLFADDAKLYSPIKEENDRTRMQVGLKMLKNGLNMEDVLPYQEMQISSHWEKMIWAHNISCQWIKT